MKGIRATATSFSQEKWCLFHFTWTSSEPPPGIHFMKSHMTVSKKGLGHLHQQSPVWP